MILRNLFEQFLRAAKLYEQQRASVPEVRVLDVEALGLSPVKARPRSGGDVRLVVTHVTDVTDGFGVAKSAVARWSKVELPDGWSPRDAALVERYHNKGYHWIGSATFDAVRNYAPTWRTVHANTANARSVGWALDVGHKQRLTDKHVAAGRASLRRCILDAFQANGGRALVVAPHRCFSPKRRVDTSAEVHRLVVLPTIGVLGPSICRIDYAIFENGGRPIPRDWDPNALFDSKGRRL